MSEFKISLGIDLNDGELNKLRGEISNTKFKKIKIELDTRRVNSQLNSIRKQIQNLSRIKVNLNVGTGSGSAGFIKFNGKKMYQTVSEVNKAYQDLRTLSTKINSIRFNIAGLDSSKNSKQIVELSGQLNRLMADYNNLYQTFSKRFSTDQLDNLNRSFETTSGKITALNAKVADARNNLAKGIQIKIDDNTFKNSFNNIEGQFNKVKNKSLELRAAMNQVEAAMADMNSAHARNDIEGLIGANERYERALKDVQNQLQINARYEKASAAALKVADDRRIFQSKIDAWLKDNSAAAKQFGAELLNLKAKAQSCDKVTLAHLKNEFKRIANEAEAAGKTTQTLGDRLKHQFSKYSMYFSTASAIIYTTQALRDMFNQVVAIDSAMTELKKVTDETNATYNKFLTNAAGRASEIGTTIDGLISSTADFARLGYDFTDAGKLAEVANIYTVVGDEIDGVDTATQSLISTMKAFKDEAGGLSEGDFAMGIVDKMNEVSNNFAISSGGIGEALTRSASSLAAANNSLDESIALITASNTVVQDPTVVGTALKTKFCLNV